MENKLLKHPYFKKMVIFLGLIVVFFIMLWIRAFYSSMEAYKDGEKHLNANQIIRAITFYDRSIHWYTPFNPYVQKSAKRLWEIGTEAEQQGDTKLALIAYRTIRQGFYSARSFYQPGGDWINQSDNKINTFLFKGQDKGETADGTQLNGKKYLKNQKLKDPSIFWTIVLEISFLGWIGTVIGFIVFPLKDIKSFHSFFWAFLRWGIPFFIFFVFWIIGMTNA